MLSNFNILPNVENKMSGSIFYGQSMALKILFSNYPFTERFCEKILVLCF